MTAAQRSNADRMIEGKGQAITIAGETAGTYDPANGTTTPTTPYSATTYGVLLPLDKSRKVDGTTIVAGDETLLISALDNTDAAISEPPVNSVVTLAGGGKRVIVAIDVLAPAGLTIMFDAVVRKTA